MEGKKIIFNKVWFDGQEQLTISFDTDIETTDYIKNFEGVLWSESLKTFYVPFSKQNTNAVFQYLRKKRYYIDYELLKSNYYGSIPPIIRQQIKITDKPQQEVKQQIEEFKKWMRQKRYSSNTIKTYESMLVLFFGYYRTKSPDEIVQKDVENFNHDYILANQYSFTYQNQLINALKLFYSQKGLQMESLNQLQRPNKQKKLPEVLSIEEVKELLVSITNLKHRTLLSLLYACGLRIGETLSIKMLDIDLERRFTHIKSGKGSKDRYVPIPNQMCLLLKKYITSYNPKYYLFEGMYGLNYSPVSARQVLKRALKGLNIKKTVTLHTLRHSHATHLLESGTDIRYIQELLGHNNPKTTMIYTHVSTASLDKIKNPFDEFEI